MPRTTQCPSCGVVLNLPDNAAGKRLKCPKCGTRFTAEGSVEDVKPDSKAPDMQSSSGPASSLLLTTRQSEPDLPTAEGDLRDTFDPSLLMGEEQTGKPTGARGGTEADAASLFERPTRPRGPSTIAEARSKPRRCPDCSSVVPAGMSLCARCGLDLDTGKRHQLDELFESPPPPPRPSAPPLTITVIGILTLIISLVLGLLGLVGSQKPETPSWVYGSLGLVGFFGIYASIQFLRLKAMKPLVTALMLGAILDVGLLIVHPIAVANSRPSITAPGGTGYVVSVADDAPQIESVAQRLQDQMWKVNWGIALLLIDIGLIIFLLTGGVKKHFERKHAMSMLPIPGIR